MNVSFIICNILGNILKISNFEWHGFQNHVKTSQKFSKIESFKLKDSNLFPMFGLANNKFCCLYKNPGYDRKVHFLLDFNLDSKRHDYPKHQLYGTAATTMWNSIHIRQRPLG